LTVQQFQDICKDARTKSGIRRVFTANTLRAVALRGTLAQLLHADALLR
jgi:hypothetical protein